jgi:hypothetical protein
VLKKWLHFWFEPASPANLGISRVLFFSGLLLFYSQEDFSAWGSVSSAFWMPLPLFSALHLTPASPAVLGVMQALWRVALVLSAAGVFTRASMTVSAALGFYLLGLPHNFGHTFHFDAALVIACIVLACSRAGDAWSVDRLVGRTSGGSEPGGEYTWPTRMIWVATALVFLAAGIAKLRYGGIGWVASDNMRILLLRAAYHVSDADPITTAGLWIAAHHVLSRGLAALALAIEVGFVASLFSRRARIVFVPGAFLMLIGIRALMGPTFGGFLLVNVFWVPWDAIAQRVVEWRARQVSLPTAAAQDDMSSTASSERRGHPDDVLVEHL